MKQNKIIIVIIAAALIIAGALVFLGLRLGGGSSSNGSFAEQLEQYQASQEQAQIDAREKADQEAEKKAESVPGISDADHVKGNIDAPITIYEYSDFECPFCKRFYKTPGQLVENNNGKVNTVFRHFPLDFHDPLATEQALASECVANLGGNDKFWQYHDKIFATTNSNGRGMEVSQLTTIATDLGINKGAFQSCLDSEKYLDKVQTDIATGVLSGVTGTPGVIVKNNKTGKVKFIAGAYPIEYIQQQIDDLLK